MKEAVTKFDFESAFKALDEIDIPVAENGIKANRPALTEIFSHKTKFDSLMEEYYDVSDTEELGEAQEAREAEVAKAKLERIEKIVDLDADSPEDLLTSYVGKYIMQCPQCMTLFYKDQEDIVESEDDPTTVNVNEACQHCGNESGYTLVGKVGEATPEDNFDTDDVTVSDEEIPTEEIPEDAAEDQTEETSEESDLGDLDELDLNLDVEEDETKTEESFTAHEGEALVEEFSDDKELDDKLEAHSEYIEYLRAAIAQEEEKLEKTTNEQVKVAIQRNIDTFKMDLEGALPEAVKNEISEEEVVEVPAEESIDDTSDEASIIEDNAEEEQEVQEESCANSSDSEALTEALHEDKDLDISAAEFDELINSPEFKKPISDTAVRAIIDSEKEEEKEEKEENIDESLAEGIFDIFKTRAGKAEWVLKNALIDYEKAVLDKANKVETDPANRKYNTFVVVCYKGLDKTNNEIKQAPNPSDSSKLVPGTKFPDAKTKYDDAEKLAKGWSMKSDGGPAFIYLAKSAEDDKAEFLCQYFKGKLDSESDRLDEIVETIKTDIKGSKLRVKGGTDQSEIRKVKGDSLKAGMRIQLQDKNYEVVAIKKVTDPEFGEAYRVTYIDESGKKVNLPNRPINHEFTVMRDSIANESLETVMSNIEELNESSLEALISNSLVESYGNVSEFKLSECAYLDNKFTVSGTIHFNSGNTRETTYTFNESCEVEEGKIGLKGLNEKLGLDKQFMITGYTNSNKTFIVESFKATKK